MTTPPIHVLVVDDSAVVRQAVTTLLTAAGGFRVTVAADPIIARRKMEVDPPDVMLLDLELPRMHGLDFLEELMKSSRLPVVILSGQVGHGTEAALRALSLGAVAIVAKPQLGVREFLQDAAVLVGETLREAADIKRKRARPALAAPAPRPPSRPAGKPRSVVAVGASTGGVEALRVLLSQLPPDAPAHLVVQHMPAGFTRAFANDLDRICRVEVREASAGDLPRPGLVLIAPGNRHLELIRRSGRYEIDVRDGPPVSRHRPSVDVLFRSCATAAGADAVGVLLTGMGDDGARGLLELKAAGAATLAQSEESCVVFGMPKEAISLGAVDQVLPLTCLADAILGLCSAAKRDSSTKGELHP